MQQDEPRWRASLKAAFAAADARNWKTCQELCALTAEQQPPTVMAVSRLNILICQYQLGFTNQIPERALPLISHLPAGGVVTTLGLSLLAAKKSGTLLDFKSLALALADERHQAFDLPTVPTFVLLHENETDCTVQENADAALMSEVVATFLSAGNLSSQETAKLESLARRYRERAAATAVSHFRADGATERKKSWWKPW